jgi:hypothetical protein
MPMEKSSYLVVDGMFPEHPMPLTPTMTDKIPPPTSIFPAKTTTARAYKKSLGKGKLGYLRRLRIYGRYSYLTRKKHALYSKKTGMFPLNIVRQNAFLK